MSVPLALQITVSRARRGVAEDDSAHTDSGDHPWEINIPDHPKRKEYSGFQASKRLAKKILELAGVDERFLGSKTLQMHHGGSLWVLGADGWFMVQNEAGIEWSGQFCADPAKVDSLRLNARRLYAGFPETIPKMIDLGYKNAQLILDTAVTDAETIAAWVDSIFNSCVPLPANRHVGVLPKGGGRHHYPTPITDIDLVKHDDFQLWVTDPDSGEIAAVVPVAPRGAGVDKVRVVYAAPRTALADQQARREALGKSLELDGQKALTRQAYARQ